MRTKISPRSLVTLLSTLLIAMIGDGVFAEEPLPTISVTGTARIRLPADEVVVHASIESVAKTASEACKDNQAKSQALIDFLKSHNVEEQQIDSELVNISEISSNRSSKGRGGSGSDDLFGEVSAESRVLGQRSRPSGYRANRNLIIVIKDLKKFEEIYFGIVESGVNRVDRVRPRSSQESKLAEKLRKAAVLDAKAQASAMASELGVKLLSVKSIAKSRIDTSGTEGRSEGMDGMGYGSGGDPFGGESQTQGGSFINLVSTVEVVFYLDKEMPN